MFLKLKVLEIFLITLKGFDLIDFIFIFFFFFVKKNFYSWKPIVECVEERYDAYLDQERRVNRRNIQDNRIHACLYFISPTGHSLVFFFFFFFFEKSIINKKNKFKFKLN